MEEIRKYNQRITNIRTNNSLIHSQRHPINSPSPSCNSNTINAIKNDDIKNNHSITHEIISEQDQYLFSKIKRTNSLSIPKKNNKIVNNSTPPPCSIYIGSYHHLNNYITNNDHSSSSRSSSKKKNVKKKSNSNYLPSARFSHNILACSIFISPFSSPDYSSSFISPAYPFRSHLFTPSSLLSSSSWSLSSPFSFSLQSPLIPFFSSS